MQNWLNEQAGLKPATAVVYRHCCQPEWRTEFVSDHVASLTGYSAKDLSSEGLNSFLDIVYSEDIFRVRDAWLAPLSTALEDGYRLAYRIVTKDGLIRQIYDRGRRIVQQGRGVWLTGVMFDVTQTKESLTELDAHAQDPETSLFSMAGAITSARLDEANSSEQSLQRLLIESQTRHEQLQESYQELAIAHLALAAKQQRYRDLFNLAPVGYLVTDTAGIIDAANQAIAQLLQVEPQHLMGQSLQTFIAPAQTGYFQQFWQQLTQKALPKEALTKEALTEGPANQTLVLTLRAATQAEFPAELTVGLVENGHQEIIGFRWLVRYLTEQQQPESDVLRLNIQLQEQLKVQTAALKRATRQLEKFAFLDHLTRVANRRQFDEHLQQEWRRAQRQGSPLTLILCDVDHFKHYNDHYGHPAGDACLRRVAKVLKQTIGRPGDLVARYGGEEFALILPATGVEGAIKLIDKTRQRIANLQIMNGEQLLTLSFGIASVMPGRQDYQFKLIAAADQALYFAKRNGRNGYHVGHLEDFESGTLS